MADLIEGATWPRDQLIAWAYRYFANTQGISSNGETYYPSAVAEFFRAAERLVPDVRDRSLTVDQHADIAIIAPADDADANHT